MHLGPKASKDGSRPVRPLDSRMAARDRRSLKQPQHGKIRLYYLFFVLGAVFFILYVLKSKGSPSTTARPVNTGQDVQLNRSNSTNDKAANAEKQGSPAAESPAAQSTTPPRMSLEEAVSKPVLVHLSTSHFFGSSYERTIPDCTYQGRPITCTWGRHDLHAADVLWHHGCPQPVTKARPEQLSVIMYMESAANYPCLDNPAAMDQMDLEMTYRLCSHVITHYFDFTHETVRTKLFSAPEPFETKKDAVAYVNSNCNAMSGRDKMIQALMDTGKIPIHAHGACLRNQPVASAFDKVQLFRGYKFCVAIENSLSKDYMTEKLWNAFTAGCVPIYLGPPNVKDFLPEDNSIVLWSDFSNADAVADELVRLMNNKTAYEEKLRWKHFKSIKQLNLGLRELMGTDVAPKFHSQCQICQLVVSNRITPRDFKGTHCMRNTSWLANNSSSWTPEAAGYARITDAVDFQLPG